MSITKLHQKVKEHQEPIGRKLHIVATRAGIHHSEWVENADRWVAGFLEKFEEGCYLMETSIKTRIQKGLMKEQVKQTNDQLQKC
jgi:choline-phosphate cytidylyltransferase